MTAAMCPGPLFGHVPEIGGTACCCRHARAIRTATSRSHPRDRDEPGHGRVPRTGRETTGCRAEMNDPEAVRIERRTRIPPLGACE